MGDMLGQVGQIFHLVLVVCYVSWCKSWCVLPYNLLSPRSGGGGALALLRICKVGSQISRKGRNMKPG